MLMKTVAVQVHTNAHAKCGHLSKKRTAFPSHSPTVQESKTAKSSIRKPRKSSALPKDRMNALPKTSSSRAPPRVHPENLVAPSLASSTTPIEPNTPPVQSRHSPPWEFPSASPQTSNSPHDPSTHSSPSYSPQQNSEPVSPLIPAKPDPQLPLSPIPGPSSQPPVRPNLFPSEPTRQPPFPEQSHSQPQFSGSQADPHRLPRVLGMRRAHTYGGTPTSTEMSSVLPSKQRAFKPPLSRAPPLSLAIPSSKHTLPPPDRVRQATPQDKLSHLPSQNDVDGDSSMLDNATQHSPSSSPFPEADSSFGELPFDIDMLEEELKKYD